MAEKVDYVISGVWKNSGGVITHVFIHEKTPDDFKKGLKASGADVIKLINSKKIVYTITWDYPNWNWGAKVDVVSSFLRTDRNKTAKDNLDNLINMDSLI